MLAVSLSGSCSSVAMNLSVTVPVGAQAVVAVPTFASPASTLTITEGGMPVWENGKYVDGVQGVTGAATAMDKSGETVVQVFTGSGSYAFSATG